MAVIHSLYREGGTHTPALALILGYPATTFKMAIRRHFVGREESAPNLKENS